MSARRGFTDHTAGLGMALRASIAELTGKAALNDAAARVERRLLREEENGGDAFLDLVDRRLPKEHGGNKLDDLKF